MTQSNIGNPRGKPDSIGVADWSYDEHMTGKYAVPTGNASMPYQVMLEGNFWPSISGECEQPSRNGRPLLPATDLSDPKACALSLCGGVCSLTT
jgi:hypothetical protein